jgi:hypothetical protein
MFKADKFWIGAILGFIFPVIAFISVKFLKFDVHIAGKDNLLYIGAAILNLGIMRFYYSREKTNTAAGVIFATFICAILFILKIR